MRNPGIKIILFLILAILSNEILYTANVVKDYRNNLQFTFGKDEHNVYSTTSRYKSKVSRDIGDAFNKVWDEFTKKGASKLPKCVVEAFEALRDKKINIIYIAEGLINHPHGLYNSGKIYIYNTFFATPCEIQSIIFHEMLHQAFTEMSEKEKARKQKDRIFCVKIINEYIKDCPDGNEVTDYECTNIFNFGSDEGIVEDCEKKLLLTINSVFYKIVNTSYNYIYFKYNTTRKDWQREEKR
jgi:hypothetical protein